MNIETKSAPLRIFRDSIDGEYGWWLDASEISPDVPFWGAYRTQAEAREARRSYLASNPEAKQRRTVK